MKNIQFILPNVDLDQVCDLLLEWGVLSASIQNSGNDDSAQNAWFDEPGQPRWEAWENPVVVALVDEETEASSLAGKIRAEFGLELNPSYSEEMVADVDWVRETQKINQPNQITDRLWIIPTGQAPVDPKGANVFLDPGVAFGTGSHPTTRLCLKWLSDNLTSGESVLDYGCGSGILAIAALKLGATSAIGVDIDPQSLKSTEENAQLNDLSIPTYDPEELPDHQKYDILIANILANPLIELMPEFSSLLRPGGRIAVSGIMESQTELIEEKYGRFFSNISAKTEEGWALISGFIEVN